MVLVVSVVCFLFNYMYFSWKFLQANVEDPDKTPLNAASDQGLHRLHMAHYGYKKGLIYIGLNNILFKENTYT